ncbi:MAG: FliM/FliN family flagellar motor switch protein [Chlamydiia bacterium]|nr:FliM/FliN family flagellar motor switch protein [Chlamydiia bacterium]
MAEGSDTLPKSQIRILKSIKDTQLPVSIVLMRQSFSVGELMSLCPGGILMFSRQADAPAQLQVNGQSFAEGVVVQVGEHYGLKMQKVLQRNEA